MRLLSALLCTVLIAPSVSGTAFAAPLEPSRPQAASAATGVDPAATVAEVRRIIATRYVLPERRAALDAVLAEGLSSGRYAGISATDLAERINADLARVGHDQHLNFRYAPREAVQLAAQGAAGPADPGATGDFSAYERQIRAANHGITDLRLLPGNIRLMRYDGFHYMGEETDQALTDAMRFLSGGDAVIIDLRTNGGGDPAAVQQIISRFLAPGTPLVTFYMNGEADPNGLSALPDPLVGRMVGKPLYVLTSGGTASAAEEFTGHVLGYHLGEVVGANTAGAGFRNDIVPVGDQFLLSVSVGRAVLASTGKDWEAVGHAPTIPTAVPAALDVAQLTALKRLAANATDDRKSELEGLAESLDARITPRTPAHALTTYVGTYGERTVKLEGQGLVYQRGDRAPFRLIALGGDVFTTEADPAVRITFDPGRAGAASAEALSMSRADAPAQTRYDRSGN